MASIRHSAFGTGSALWLLLAALPILVVAVPAQASQAEEPNYAVEGPYEVIAGGVGMHEELTGDIALNVPGTPVKALLLWAGLGQNSAIELSIDGGAATEVPAEEEYLSPWGCCGGLLGAYLADVTTLVRPGAHTYTVSGMDFAEGSWGADLIVVHDAYTGLYRRRVEVRIGNDGFWHGWSGELGPNSKVQCFELRPTLTERVIHVTITAGGGRADRPNALWFQSGHGPWPEYLIDLPPEFNGSGTEIAGPASTGTYPFVAADGLQWDTYSTIVWVLGGDEWACFQIESVARPGMDLDGASIGWFALAGFWDPARREGSIGDTVWCDANKDGTYQVTEGVDGVTLFLYADAQCDGIPGNLLQTQDTARYDQGGGHYLFSGLEIGLPGEPVCYVVWVDQADMGACSNPITPLEYAVSLDTYYYDDLDSDFGFALRETPPPIVPEASPLILVGSTVAALAGYVALQLRARWNR